MDGSHRVTADAQLLRKNQLPGAGRRQGHLLAGSPEQGLQAEKKCPGSDVFVVLTGLGVTWGGVGW